MSSTAETCAANEINFQSDFRRVLRLNRNGVGAYLNRSACANTVDSAVSTKYRKNRTEKNAENIHKNDCIETEYDSWKWQPKVCLQRVTQPDFNQTEKSDASSCARAMPSCSPIRFDRDEPIIREISPRTAKKAFEKVKIK